MVDMFWFQEETIVLKCLPATSENILSIPGEKYWSIRSDKSNKVWILHFFHTPGIATYIAKLSFGERTLHCFREDKQLCVQQKMPRKAATSRSFSLFVLTCKCTTKFLDAFLSSLLTWKDIETCCASHHDILDYIIKPSQEKKSLVHIYLIYISSMHVYHSRVSVKSYSLELGHYLLSNQHVPYKQDTPG